ncbi:MAG TPA: glycosyltransferase [Chitinophagaceae bacterium]|nr:glycosyltransferase [Chitinophagaceae bacterium]
MKKLYFTVTNDLSYDQRMQRICTTLAENGYVVTLVGRKLSTSIPLTKEKYKQKRIRCWFNKGKLFYFEYNLRLSCYLLSRKMDAICAIDLDTIMPCHFVSGFKRIPRIYDAHELFTELKEVITRPRIKKIWTRVEKRLVPKFKLGYTVSESIAEEFLRRYAVKYKTIRNLPVLKEFDTIPTAEKFILYQGAVNEARGFEFLIPAMNWVNCKLVICGDGNFMPQVKELIADHKLENKIEWKGMLPPAEIWKISQQATVGIALAEKEGLNQWLALPNKFFDYVHAGLPQVTMDYPEYSKINKQFEVAVLINDLAPKSIADAINNLLTNEVLYSKLKSNCLVARQELNWQHEEKKLLSFYQSILAK